MASPTFSGHETFPLRFTWPAKAVEATDRDRGIFGDDSAIAEFGVGRNMVRAIRHWGLATGVLQAEGRGLVGPSAFGRAVFGPDGADPYCEDPSTLWLLHWHLCRDAGRAALWHFVFGHWRGGALDLRTLAPALADWLRAVDEAPPKTGTLKRDLACLAACYAPPAPRQDPEDAVSCPLTSLGLLSLSGGALHLHEGRKRGLEPAVFATAVLDHWRRQRPGAETLAVQDVLERSGSPGRVFLLSEEQAFDLLTRAEATGAFRYDDTAGVRQLYRTSDAAPADLLDTIYATAA